MTKEQGDGIKSWIDKFIKEEQGNKLSSFSCTALKAIITKEIDLIVERDKTKLEKNCGKGK